MAWIPNLPLEVLSEQEIAKKTQVLETLMLQAMAPGAPTEIKHLKMVMVQRNKTILLLMEMGLVLNRNQKMELQSCHLMSR